MKLDKLLCCLFLFAFLAAMEFFHINDDPDKQKLFQSIVNRKKWIPLY